MLLIALLPFVKTVSCVFDQIDGVRVELSKAGVMPTLFTAIEMIDVRVQAVACLALSCFLQDGKPYIYKDEVMTTISKNLKIVMRIVQLLKSPDNSVSRNAAHTISKASRNGRPLINSQTRLLVLLVVREP